MRVFVTGGTGFIGGEVVRQLRARGDDVVCLVRDPARAQALADLGCELVPGDLGDSAALRTGCTGADAAIHVAAMYEIGIPNRQRPAMWEANVAGTERLFAAALAAAVPKVVHVSTLGAFGNTHNRVVDETYVHPGKEFTSYYEETKLAAHRLAHKMHEEQGLPVVVAMPCGVYGPGDTSQVADMVELLLAGRLPFVPFPEFGMCMAHVEDIAGGILLALDRGRVGEDYALSGPVTTMRDAIGIVARLAGRKAPRHAMPAALIRAAAPLGPLLGRLFKQPPNLRELVSSADGVTYWASHEKASRELGYDPRGLEEGMRQTLAADPRFPDPVPAGAPTA